MNTIKIIIFIYKMLFWLNRTVSSHCKSSWLQIHKNIPFLCLPGLNMSNSNSNNKTFQFWWMTICLHFHCQCLCLRPKKKKQQQPKKSHCEIQGCKEFSFVLMIITDLHLKLSSLGQFDLIFMFWERLHLP